MILQGSRSTHEVGAKTRRLLEKGKAYNFMSPVKVMHVAVDSGSLRVANESPVSRSTSPLTAVVTSGTTNLLVRRQVTNPLSRVAARHQ